MTVTQVVDLIESETTAVLVRSVAQLQTARAVQSTMADRGMASIYIDAATESAVWASLPGSDPAVDRSLAERVAAVREHVITMATSAGVATTVIVDQVGLADSESIELLTSLAHQNIPLRWVLVIDPLRSASVPGLDALAQISVAVDVETGDTPWKANEHALEETDHGWALIIRRTRFDLDDLNGFELIAQLLARPRTDLHVLDMVMALDGRPADRTVDDFTPATAGTSTDAILDRRAIVQYRQQLQILRQAPVTEATQAEIQFLEETLRRDLRPDGRSRSTSSEAERARIRVQKLLKRALDHLETVHQEAGNQLRAAIETGYYCRYRSDVVVESWQVVRRRT